MRITRLLGVLAALMAAIALTGLLVAPGAGAKPPMRLPGYVNDYAGALKGGQLATVKAAVGKLYTDRHIRLWVVYVDTFSGHTGDSWSRATVRLSDLGDYDALLAVATTDRSYGFLVSSALTDAGSVERMRRDTIEPALGRGDWSGAALAAVNGLRGARPTGPAPLNWTAMLMALTAVGAAGVGVLVVVRLLRRRRRAAALAAARLVDPTDADALARLPLSALDDLSRLKVVDVDNAVRTSANELALAIGEFGAQRTEPFIQAVANARAALTRALTVRQRLDDAIPDTPTHRRDLLTGVIVDAAKADRELDTQREAFEQLRDLVLHAPARLDALTQQVVELTARLPVAAQHLGVLAGEFDAAALTSVSGNVAAAQDRVAFADRNIGRARALADRPVTGGQSELVDALRAAESGVGQAAALLDAVDSAAGDIRHAVAALPGAIADTEAGIEQAGALLRSDGSGALTRARDAAAKAVATARRSNDPLGAFTSLAKAAAELDRLLAAVAEQQAAAERLTRALEQALFTAQSRVRAVSDFIDTRRGSVGAEARTRLAEARRRMQLAADKRATDAAAALADANDAAILAASAQSLAEADVAAAQRSYHGRHGDDAGAMLGGIIIGSMLGRGSSGDWTPTSFGGSAGSSSTGGGFFGGGGRF